MFCSNCGNQIPDGSSFCSSCGNRVGGGFNGAAPYMTKKEYFETSCSVKAKNIMKAGKIVLIVCSVLMLISSVLTLWGMNVIFEEVDFESNDIKTVFQRMEELAGEDLGLTDEDYEEMLSLEKELGFTLVEFVKTMVYVVVGAMVLLEVAIIILSYFTVRNKSLATAIIALVLAVLFVGGLVEFGLTVTLLVLVCILRKEYNTYCENPFVFNTANSSNEPDFSN